MIPENDGFSAMYRCYKTAFLVAKQDMQHEAMFWRSTLLEGQVLRTVSQATLDGNVQRELNETLH